MEKDEKTSSRESSFWEQLTVLLTIIGLWLALPATCGLMQRIVDNVALLELMKQHTFTIVKVALDSCLLGIYIFGLITLILLGGSAFLAARALATTSEVITIAGRKIDQVKTTRGGLFGILSETWKWVKSPKIWWESFKRILFGPPDIEQKDN